MTYDINMEFFGHATCWMSYNENMEEFAAHSVYKINSCFFVQHIETLFSAKDYRSIVLEKEINVTLYYGQGGLGNWEGILMPSIFFSSGGRANIK